MDICALHVYSCLDAAVGRTGDLHWEGKRRGKDTGEKTEREGAGKAH